MTNERDNPLSVELAEYAKKAGDAETLGRHPAGDFLQISIQTVVFSSESACEAWIAEKYLSLPDHSIYQEIAACNYGSNKLGNGEWFVTFMRTNSLYGTITAFRYDPSQVRIRTRAYWNGVWQKWYEYPGTVLE